MRRIAPLLLLACTVNLGGCRSGLPSTQFVNPQFDFSYVERVAVLPFENLSNDRQAGFRATRLTITELLASGAVEVVEPGEVQAAMSKLPGAVFGRVRLPSTEEIVSLAEALDVQAVVIGSVTQSEKLRSGAVGIPVVTLDMHMVEAETGAAVWASTHTERGSSVSARVLGTGGEAISETTRRCVQNMLEALIE
jgi:TolB-like protein